MLLDIQFELPSRAAATSRCTAAGELVREHILVLDWHSIIQYEAAQWSGRVPRPHCRWAIHLSCNKAIHGCMSRLLNRSCRHVETLIISHVKQRWLSSVYLSTLFFTSSCCPPIHNDQFLTSNSRPRRNCRKSEGQRISDDPVSMNFVLESANEGDVCRDVIRFVLMWSNG